MTTPQLIHCPWPHSTAGTVPTVLPIDRATLAKRRWRGVAEDGVEFGFDLEAPLLEGAIFFADDARHYLLAQKPEPVLLIELHDPTQAARVAWSLGNLHFPIEVRANLILAPDDPAIRHQLARDHVHFAESVEIFRPIKAAAHTH